MALLAYPTPVPNSNAATLICSGQGALCEALHGALRVLGNPSTSVLHLKKCLQRLHSNEKITPSHPRIKPLGGILRAGLRAGLRHESRARPTSS